jgi:phage FluMu protein Com
MKTKKCRKCNLLLGKIEQFDVEKYLQYLRDN